MGRMSKLLVLLALTAGAYTANTSPLRTLLSPDTTLLQTNAKAKDSSLDEADTGDSEVDNDDYDDESSYEDGSYYYDGDDDSQTVSELVNTYHSGKADYDSSDAYISGGVEECDDCTSAVVPVGEYDEYVQYFTTEYDEYYLVKVPVVRHDVYTIREVPEVSHSVYYTTGDYVVQDQVTECDDCTSGYTTSESSESSSTSSSSSSSESSSSSSSEESSEDSSTTVTKETSSRSSESSEEEEAEVDTNGRKSSSSNTSEESSESSESSEDSDTYVTYKSSESSEDSDNSSTSESSEEEEVDEDEACDVSDEMTVTEVTEYDEYIVQEIEGGCEHCDDELFLQVTAKADSYPQLSGDLYDNDETDSSYLTLVSPSEDTAQVDWTEDIYDGDESEYQDDLEDTDNPGALQSAFLQVVDNALGRDTDDLPDDADDEGDDQVDGDFYFLLVSTFEDGVESSGKIIVVPEDDDEENFTLITGLDKPVGICFDNNNEFLYVADPTYGDSGYIYQFTVDWDEDDTFVLKSNEYTVIYSGTNPSSCFVDEYGNIYFTDATENQINMISYLDLWSGYTNYYYTIYERDDDTQEIDTPTGINVFDSSDLYFVNNNVENGAPVLAKAEANVKGKNSKDIKRKVEGKSGAWGVAVSDDYVFFTTQEGSLWAMDREDKSEAIEKASKFFAEPRGVCYGQNDLYVADYSRGQIYDFNDNDDEESGDVWETIEYPYAVYCVNNAFGLGLSLVAFVLLQ
mmetsp:Transcript_8234/g.16221  ORF Transcript_8234/g.16221 Transcript_8234/m.16221 type:complete len:742 (+) Transcript_8234:143-2368(+)